MDSGVLFGSKEMIEQRVRETAKAAKDMGVRHVMNLGHGIMQVRGGPIRGLAPGRAGTACGKRAARAAGWAGAGAAACARRGRRWARAGAAAGRRRAAPGAGAAARAARLPSCVHRPARPPLTAHLPAAPPPQGTPEENAAHFFKVAKELRYADL